MLGWNLGRSHCARDHHPHRGGCGKGKSLVCARAAQGTLGAAGCTGPIDAVVGNIFMCKYFYIYRYKSEIVLKLN